jgi:hypothetical protein
LPPPGEECEEAEARKRRLLEGTLDCYFQGPDGVDLAYRPAERGVEVLGVGFEEVLAIRKGHGDGAGADIRFGQL